MYNGTYHAAPLSRAQHGPQPQFTLGQARQAAASAPHLEDLRILQPLASGGRAGSPAVVVQHQLGQRLSQGSAQRELRLHACGKFWQGQRRECY